MKRKLIAIASLLTISMLPGMAEIEQSEYGVYLLIKAEEKTAEQNDSGNGG